MKTGKRTTKNSLENEPKKSKRIGLAVKVSKSEPVKKAKTEFEQHEENVYEELKLPSAEKDKVILMWSGVVFFMIVIIGFWFFNMQRSIGIFKPNNKEKGFDWNEINKISDEFTKNINLTKEQIATMKSTLSAQEQVSTTTIASSTPEQSSLNSLPTDNKLDQQDLDKVKQKILELDKE